MAAKINRRLLIEAVRSYPELYDPRHTKYNDSTHRGGIWKQIAEDLGADGGPAVCKAKWRNIKRHYKRTLRKKLNTSGMSAYGIINYQFEALLGSQEPRVTVRDIITNELHPQEEGNGAGEIYCAEMSRGRGVDCQAGLVIENEIPVMEESQPQHQNRYDVDEFLSGISAILKTLDQDLLNDAKSKIDCIVHEFNMSQNARQIVMNYTHRSEENEGSLSEIKEDGTDNLEEELRFTLLNDAESHSMPQSSPEFISMWHGEFLTSEENEGSLSKIKEDGTDNMEEELCFALLNDAESHSMPQMSPEVISMWHGEFPTSEENEGSLSEIKEDGTDNLQEELRLALLNDAESHRMPQLSPEVISMRHGEFPTSEENEVSLSEIKEDGTDNLEEELRFALLNDAEFHSMRQLSPEVISMWHGEFPMSEENEGSLSEIKEDGTENLEEELRFALLNDAESHSMPQLSREVISMWHGEFPTSEENEGSLSEIKEDGTDNLKEELSFALLNDAESHSMPQLSPEEISMRHGEFPAREENEVSLSEIKEDGTGNLEEELHFILLNDAESHSTPQLSPEVISMRYGVFPKSKENDVGPSEIKEDGTGSLEVELRFTLLNDAESHSIPQLSPEVISMRYGVFPKSEQHDGSLSEIKEDGTGNLEVELRFTLLNDAESHSIPQLSPEVISMRHGEFPKSEQHDGSLSEIKEDGTGNLEVELRFTLLNDPESHNIPQLSPEVISMRHGEFLASEENDGGLSEIKEDGTGTRVLELRFTLLNDAESHSIPQLSPEVISMRYGEFLASEENDGGLGDIKEDGTGNLEVELRFTLLNDAELQSMSQLSHAVNFEEHGDFHGRTCATCRRYSSSPPLVRKCSCKLYFHKQSQEEEALGSPLCTAMTREQLQSCPTHQDTIGQLNGELRVSREEYPGDREDEVLPGRRGRVSRCVRILRWLAQCCCAGPQRSRRQTAT